MRKINDYNEYISALKDKSSKDPAVCAEVKKALDDLQQRDPNRYTLYRVLNGEIEAPESLVPKKEKKVVEKGQYIREHPEINVIEERKKARERLLKRANGLDWRFYKPVWISEEDMLKSLEQLTLPELLTISGKPIPRQTLINRCVKKSVAERRIDEKKLRAVVCNLFSSYYNSGLITLKHSYLFEPVKRMLREEATVDELVNVADRWGIDIDKLVRLVNSKQIKVTDEDINNYEMKLRGQAKQSKNARKRAKRRAEKEAALKKALEEDERILHE